MQKRKSLSKKFGRFLKLLVKQVIAIHAQAKAEQELVKHENKARHKAVEINTIAQAKMEAAAKDADAMKRMAEGIEALGSRCGLDAVRNDEIPYSSDIIKVEMWHAGGGNLAIAGECDDLRDFSHQ